MLNKLETIITPKEEWHNLKQEIENSVMQVKDYAREKAGNRWWEGRIAEFGNKVKANVPDYGKYIAWHRLISSGTDFKTSPKFDLPEPYSVRSFIQECVKELDDL